VRLTRRARRLAVVLALFGGVVLGSLLNSLVSGTAADGLHLAGVNSVVVAPGDTLWSIAESVADGADVRVVVDRIQELNELDGSVLVPGEVLQLP
jgi:nucleoid-associated protein YgaU